LRPFNREIAKNLVRAAANYRFMLVAAVTLKQERPALGWAFRYSRIDQKMFADFLEAEVDAGLRDIRGVFHDSPASRNERSETASP
jgi:hypothetical protein